MALILILEDDRPLSDQWRLMLQEQGHEVDTVTTASAAETMADRRDYDLVIVDMFLRDVDGRLSKEGGLTFLAKLYHRYTLDGAPTPKRIAVTGASQNQYFNYDPLISAETMRVDETLRKPFDNGDLLLAVSDLLSTPS